jgi:hypothetical protein
VIRIGYQAVDPACASSAPVSEPSLPLAGITVVALEQAAAVQNIVVGEPDVPDLA